MSVWTVRGALFVPQVYLSQDIEKAFGELEKALRDCLMRLLVSQRKRVEL